MAQVQIPMTEINSGDSHQGSPTAEPGFWRAALASIGDGVILTDNVGRVTFINPVAESLCGWTTDEADGKHIHEVFEIANETTRRPAPNPVDRALREQTVVGLENHTVLIRRDGQETPIDDTAAPIVDEQGRLTGAVLVFRDFTEKRRAAEANERLAAIIGSSDDIIVSKDLNGVIMSWNKGAERILGYTADEIVGKHVSMLMPEAQLEDTEKILGYIRRGERVDHYETKRRTKDGRIVDVSLTVSPIRDAHGTIVGASKVGRDITERKRSRELRERMAAIVDSSDDIIVSKDLYGAITSWNKGAEKILGYTADEMIGQHVSVLMPEEHLEDLSKILNCISRGESVEHYETQRRRKDGVIIDVSLTVSPLRDEHGNVVGASKIGRDITERKKAEGLLLQREEELRQAAVERESLLDAERAARSEIERISIMKDEFLATVSHELRTPLNAILGWSQLLAQGVGDDLREGLDVIQRNARAQTQLIDDLLDMSRIISGKVRLDVQPTDLSSVVDAAVEAVRPSADAKGIRLRKIIDPHAGPVMGDPTRLQQVIWNLLANAIKFTPKGGKVELFLERVNSHLEITIHDTGIGIKPEFLPFIFERFRQADSSSTRSHGGLGLGLSIVKNLVELHGGNVRAKSPGEGEGTTFAITLPLAPIRSVDGREHPTTSKRVSWDCTEIDLHGLKVLVVDDEPDARALISRILSQCKAEVSTASSAVEGLQQVAAFEPHVIVSDIGMPDTDGYQFIREVRRLPIEKGGKIPAIALTAFARSEDRSRAMVAGYQMHISKPIEPYELLATVFGLSGRASGE
jgi:PAS domain S-box-containing protein